MLDYNHSDVITGGELMTCMRVAVTTLRFITATRIQVEQDHAGGAQSYGVLMAVNGIQNYLCY
jgi:hypothetical protein